MVQRIKILVWLLPLFAVFVAGNPRYIIQLQPGTEILSQFIDQDAQFAAQNEHVSPMPVITTIVIGNFQAVVTELDHDGVERAKLDPHVHDILADYEVKIFSKRYQGSKDHDGAHFILEDYDPVFQPMLFPDPVERQRENLQVPPPDYIAPSPGLNDLFGETDDESCRPEEIAERDRVRKLNQHLSTAPPVGPAPTPTPASTIDPISDPAPSPEPLPFQEPIEEDKEDENEEVFIYQSNDSLYNIQEDAPSHLSRISYREGLFRKSKPYDFLYDKTGVGVTAYILDTGIAIDHPEFEGRAARGGNFITDEPEGDQHGHGTHVAGLVGSKTFGAAKDVKLVEVKVLGGNGGGSISSILSGIEYAVNHHKKHGGKSVANLSLGSMGNPIVDEAVNEAFKQGLVIVCAAGNSNIDVIFTSPARANGSFTVGALDTRGDTIAIFSNYGEKTDILAPGVEVISLNYKDHNNPIPMSGTSMASPIVAGLVAAFLEDDDVDPENVRSKLIELSTKDSINIKGLFSKYKYQTTPNRIAFNGLGDTDSTKKLKTFRPSDNLFEQDQSLLKYVQDLNDIDVIDPELWERSNKLHKQRKIQGQQHAAVADN